MSGPSSPTPDMEAREQQQPALATQKRKFHKLLDNLTASASSSTTSLARTLNDTNASTRSLSADPALPEPPSKRSRVSDVSDNSTMGRDNDRPRIVSGSERIRALQEKLFTARNRGVGSIERSSPAPAGAGIRGVTNASTPAKLSTPRKEPNFQPYSQEQFLGRLRTFADVKRWTNKPDGIGEVQWAKRGWVCDTWNTVACKGGCEQRVAIKLYPKRKDAQGKEMDLTEDLTEDADEALVERYRELIVDGHYEDCLWRKRGCADDIYHIPIPNRIKSSAELLSRYYSLRAIADELPLQENIIYPGPPAQDVLSHINPALFSPPGPSTPGGPPETPQEITAFIFALFGWSGLTESGITLATCNHCFKREGLWLYKDERLKDMSNKLDVPLSSLRLDVLEAHREHCPWKNPESQRNPKDGPIKDMAAWQTLQFLLLGNKQHKKRQENLSVTSVEFQSLRESSTDGERPFTSGTDASAARKESETLNEKWRKFKAKLRRTTSRRSLKSVKSVKSPKGVGDKDRDKENEARTAT